MTHERRRKLDIREISGAEPIEAAAQGFNYIRSDAETDALLALRAGLEAQLERLDDFIAARLEEKLAAAGRQR